MSGPISHFYGPFFSVSNVSHNSQVCIRQISFYGAKIFLTIRATEQLDGVGLTKAIHIRVHLHVCAVVLVAGIDLRRTHRGEKQEHQVSEIGRNTTST
eukprot:7369396-Pyramimonas_sp.AAC.1